MVEMVSGTIGATIGMAIEAGSNTNDDDGLKIDDDDGSTLSMASMLSFRVRFLFLDNTEDAVKYADDPNTGVKRGVSMASCPGMYSGVREVAVCTDATDDVGKENGMRIMRGGFSSVVICRYRKKMIGIVKNDCCETLALFIRSYSFPAPVNAYIGLHNPSIHAV